MCICKCGFWPCLKNIFSYNLVTLIVAIIGTLGIWYQLYQLNNFKRFENYLTFNKVYDEWYSHMPKELSNCHSRRNLTWDSLEMDDQAWVRRYFDLYAQEYYFYKNNMIPKDMWDVLINGKNNCSGAAIVNFQEYPILLDGYKVWKEKGAFKHPDDFIEMLDRKIKDCEVQINKAPLYCK